jgi:hypothetical protein
MNIFAVADCPVESAQSLCNKHVVKMITESAQMLSTAHRILDGELDMRPSVSGKRLVQYWQLSDAREDILMKAVHPSHPCTIWTMQSSDNYRWHVQHYRALAVEYTQRYGKIHGSWQNRDIGSHLIELPHNIPDGDRTPFAIAMKHYPECIVPDDPIQSYRNYYNVAKTYFACWTNRQPPYWYEGEVSWQS